MTFLEALHKTAEILAGENAEKLYDYIIHSMDDDGGFLRTRWKRIEKALTDADYSDDPKIFLVALRFPFDLKHDTEYYKEETNTFNAQSENGEPETVTITELLTVLKMQIFYTDLSDEKAFISNSEWSAGTGYPYPIRVDLEHSTAEYLDKIDLFG